MSLCNLSFCVEGCGGGGGSSGETGIHMRFSVGLHFYILSR